MAERLKIYGYYKRAVVGPVQGKAPQVSTPPPPRLRADVRALCQSCWIFLRDSAWVLLFFFFAWTVTIEDGAPWVSGGGLEIAREARRVEGRLDELAL